MPVDRKVQYTVRGIPVDVDQALRSKARARKLSLNQLIVEELTNLTGKTGDRRRRSLKGIVGGWKQDPEFDRILDAQRQIDWTLWK